MALRVEGALVYGKFEIVDKRLTKGFENKRDFPLFKQIEVHCFRQLILLLITTVLFLLQA